MTLCKYLLKVMRFLYKNYVFPITIIRFLLPLHTILFYLDMKIIRLFFLLTLALGQFSFSTAKNTDEQILRMQMEFIKYAQDNDSDGAYRMADSIKNFALDNNRLKSYYYCFNNLVIMECINGKFHHAIHISQDLLADIEQRKAFDYMPEYYKSMSTIHSARGDFKLSLEYLMKAEELSKGADCNIYLRIAELHIKKGNPEKAIKWADIAEKTGTSEVLRSNSVFRKMQAYCIMEQKDSFDVYYQKYIAYAPENISPDKLQYLPFLRSYMDEDYKNAVLCADSIKQKDERTISKLKAYLKDGNLEMAFDTQSEYIRLKDSINETIIQEDLLALNHSTEIAEANKKLAGQRQVMLTLIIIVAILLIIGSLVINVIRYKYTKKLKRQNEIIQKALDDAEKSSRIRRAMIEDIKDKSNRPQNILRTYSKIIITPDFKLTEKSKQEVFPNIRKAIDILTSLTSSVVQMYRNDELAQEIAPNGQTHIANSNNELINTINSLSGFINIMETSGYNITEPQMEEVTMQMHIDMKNIAIMFDTLLDMAYFDSYDKLPTNDHVSVNEMCQTMIADFIQRRKEDVEILFHSELADNFCVNTNYNALYKLLRYTLDNADKFTLKGTIKVECKKIDNKTRIIFSDTGSGIAENEQEKVFQRFYRSECPYPGIGLGLPICRKIASLIGCTINLNKEYKNGCQFYIEWK